MRIENPQKYSSQLPDIGSEIFNQPEIAAGSSPLAQRGKYARAQLALATSTIKSKLTACIEIERAYGSLFLVIIGCFGLGAAVFLGLQSEPKPWTAPLMLVFAIGAAIWRLRQGRALSPAHLLVVALAAGAVAAQVEISRLSTLLLDSAVTTNVTGTVERREVDHRGFWRYGLQLEVTDSPALKRAPLYVHLVARQTHDGFEVGDRINGRARLSPPSGPALVGANDFAFDAFFNGIGATGFFYAAPQIIGGGVGFSCANAWVICLDRHLYQLRAAIASHIRSTIGGDAGAFAASIITDERRAISPKVMDGLRQSGLAHIVAISGLNMALAAGIFFVGVRLLLSLSQSIAERFPVKKLSALLALVMTLCYYLISGFPVSAERAWIMTSVMLIAVMLDRQAISLRNVALSALIILAFSPSQVMRASFQMSFAATIALVAIYGAFSRRENSGTILSERTGSKIMLVLRTSLLIASTTALTSIIGGLATAPFSITYFNQVSTYGLVANLLAMPVMGLIVMPMALIAMLVMPLGLDGPFLMVMGFGMQLVIDIALTVSSWSDEQIIGRMPEWFLPAVSLSMLWMAILRSRLALFGLLPLVASCMIAFAMPIERPSLMFDENADLILIRSGERVATNKVRPNAFTFEQWQRALRLGPQNHPPKTERMSVETVEKADLIAILDALIEKSKTDPGRFYCLTRMACTAQVAPFGTVIQIIEPSLLGAGCDRGNIVITPIRTSMKRCYSGAKFYSARTLRETGAIEFHINPGNRAEPIERAALIGQRRPWNIHRYYDWRSDSFSDLP